MQEYLEILRKDEERKVKESKKELKVKNPRKRDIKRGFKKKEQAKPISIPSSKSSILVNEQNALSSDNVNWSKDGSDNDDNRFMSSISNSRKTKTRTN